MSSRLPRVTAREVQRVLEKRGFRVVRQRGSHRILRDDLGRRVTLKANFNSADPFPASARPDTLRAIVTASERLC